LARANNNLNLAKSKNNLGLLKLAKKKWRSIIIKKASKTTPRYM